MYNPSPLRQECFFCWRDIPNSLRKNLIAYSNQSNKLKLSSPQYTAVTCLIYGVVLQFILGVLTLVYHVPVVLGVLHQTGAFFLFATCIYLLYHVFKTPK